MADYLCPNNQLLVEDQILLFQIRTEINPLPANRGNPGPCPMNCQEILNNKHFFECVALNNCEKIKYEELINGNINQMKDGLIIWRKNSEILEERMALDSVF